MKESVIRACYLALSSSLDISPEIVLGYCRKDKFLAALVIAAFRLAKDKDLGIVSLDSMLSTSSQHIFPGDNGVDRHGFNYICLRVKKGDRFSEPVWVRSGKPILQQMIQPLITKMSEYGNEAKV